MQQEFNFNLYSIPFYPDLVGVPIPGSDRKTQSLHVQLFGLLISLNGREGGCYASKDYLAEKLHTTPAVIRDRRSDLIKLGWVSAIKDKYGNIERCFVHSVQFSPTPVNNPQIVTQPPTGGTPNHPQMVGVTGVRPQCYNKYPYNKDVKPAFLQKAGHSPKSIGDSPKDEPDPFQQPFGDDLTKEPSIRPTNVKDNADERARRRAYAVANDVRKRLGLKGQASSAFKQGVERWVNAGYSAEQIVEAQQMMAKSGDKYLEEASPLARLAQSNMDWYEQHRESDTSGMSGDVHEGDDRSGFLPINIPGRIY